MKTKRTLLQWAGHMIGALLSIIVALIPTGIYAVVWWFIPKTFWLIFGAAIVGIVWLAIQITWALLVAMCWDDVNAPPPLLTEDGEGDLDISF